MTAKSVPMQYEDKFHALARAVEVTEEEMQIAKFFWYAGLRHAFQRGTSSPALLEKPAPVRTPPTIFPVLDTKPATSLFEHIGEQWVEDRKLTPYEAKLLQLSTASLLREIQDGIEGVETYIGFLWKNCDPNDAKTEETFKEMNQMKNLVRRGKKQLATLNSAQRKLKKMSKGT
jgi:hypothetical protein